MEFDVFEPAVALEEALFGVAIITSEVNVSKLSYKLLVEDKFIITKSISQSIVNIVDMEYRMIL